MTRSSLAAALLALAVACSRSSAPPPTPPPPPPPTTTVPPPPPSAAASRVSLSSGSVAADGVTPARVTVVVRDAQGAAIAGVPVTIGYAGDATPEQPTVVTDASGAATFRLTAAAPTSGAVTATVAAETPVVLEAPASLAFHGCARVFSNGACVPAPWIELPPATPASVVLDDENALATGDLDGNGCDDVVVASRSVSTIEVHLGLCDGTFAPATLYTLLARDGDVGGLVVADLDGDAVLDVATQVSDRRTFTSGLRVLRGQGDGTLAPATAFVGVFVRPEAAADVDGDGDLDLLDLMYDRVRVVLNDGHGAFSAGADVAVGAMGLSSWGLRAGDLDGDGRADLVVAASGAGKVLVFRGNGDGTFAAPSTSDAPANAAPALADFDRDGRLDVLTLETNDIYPGTLHLLRGNGDGTLSAAVSFETARSARNLATGDVDGDGAADAAVIANGAPLALHLSRGGGLAPPISYDVTGSVFNSLALANLDRDGKADVVAAAAGVIRTVMGGGAGGLEATATVPVQCYGAVATGDVNGDGVLDLACAESASGGANVFYVALGLGGGLFLPAVPYASGTLPSFVAIADLDRDGYGDVIAVNGWTDYTVTTFRGAPDGVLVPAGTFPLPAGNPSGLVVADVDGDELPDAIVASSMVSTVSLLRGVGDGTFTVEALTAAFAPYDVGLGDLDADGDPDLVLVRPNPPAIAVLENSGGVFSNSVEFPGGPAGAWPSRAAIADLDGDARPDVALVDGELSRVHVLLATGPRSFAPAVSYAVGTDPQSIAVGDVNADGNADVVTGEYGSRSVTVLLGRGDGTLREGPRYLGALPYSVAVSDVDADGAGDIVAAVGRAIQIHRGPVVSAGAPPAGAIPEPGAVAAGDLDGDGALDLVTTAPTHRQWIAVALGTGGGGFGPPAALPSLNYAQDVALADLDGDDALDVVTVHMNGSTGVGSVGVILGNGDGTFQPQATYPAGTGAGRFVVADVNGDGKLDALLSWGAYLPGDGAGHFGAIVTGAGPVGDDVVAADLNGDGKLDLATALQSTSEVKTYLGDGAGGFQLRSTRTVNQAARLVAADFDGDGKVDLAAAGMTFGFLRGNGDGTVAPAALGPAIWGKSIVATDLDLDGRPDVALTTWDGAIVLLHAQADGTFETSAWQLGLVPVELADGDLDGDGRPDLAALTTSGVFPLLARVP